MSLISALKSKNIPKFFELLQSPTLSLFETEPKTGRTVIHFAVVSSDSSILSSLLSLSSPLPLDSEDYDGMTPLALAVEESNFSAIEKLVKAGADINHKLGGVSTYENTVNKNKVHTNSESIPQNEIVKGNKLRESDQYFENRSSQHAQVRTVLHIAVEKGRVDLFQKLIELGGKKEERGLMSIALKDGGYEIAMKVMEGWEAEERDEEGNNGLHLAVREGAHEILREMVGKLEKHPKKWDVYRAKNNEGNTFLHSILLNSRSNMLLLLQSSSDFPDLTRMRDSRGLTVSELKNQLEKAEEDQKKQIEEKKRQTLEKKREKGEIRRREGKKREEEERKKEEEDEKKKEEDGKVQEKGWKGGALVITVIVAMLIGMYWTLSGLEEKKRNNYID